MNRFQTTRAAKTFLAETITADAQRQGIFISDIETRMLYFSESDPCSPAIAIYEIFERDYDQPEYERKIAGVIKAFQAHARANDKALLVQWKEAVRILRKEDHYLLVLIDLGNVEEIYPTSSSKLIGAGFILACLGLAGVYLFAGR